jgi:hypothetical protein
MDMKIKTFLTAEIAEDAEKRPKYLLVPPLRGERG